LSLPVAASTSIGALVAASPSIGDDGALTRFGSGPGLIR
jgi:hypothetical protein